MDGKLNETDKGFVDDRRILAACMRMLWGSKRSQQFHGNLRISLLVSSSRTRANM